ncbi:N-acetylglucosaminyltransferase [Sesbania bispinosa]|nr:N-acetylglucosaminyltransferase [Sesbania bispinosa]
MTFCATTPPSLGTLSESWVILFVRRQSPNTSSGAAIPFGDLSSLVSPSTSSVTSEQPSTPFSLVSLASAAILIY